MKKQSSFSKITVYSWRKIESTVLKKKISALDNNTRNNINSFLSEFVFLSELGRSHIFNFLMDISDDLKKLEKNKKILKKLCYKEYFILWLSPALSHKKLNSIKKENSFFVRTSTSSAGCYTISCREKKNEVIHLRLMDKCIIKYLKIYRQKMTPLKINPIYKREVIHSAYLRVNRSIDNASIGNMMSMAQDSISGNRIEQINESSNNESGYDRTLNKNKSSSYENEDSTNVQGIHDNVNSVKMQSTDDNAIYKNTVKIQNNNDNVVNNNTVKNAE